LWEPFRRYHSAGQCSANETLPEPWPPPLPPAGRDPAVAQALAARRRRSDSAALAARDPALARDLMIGRPDLARQYYDGGLVDVNHVPASVLVAHLGLNAEQADEIIRARDDIGHFESADELVHLTSVSTAAIDAVRDRIILL
jgi:hypothetical protein